jgi:cellulose synthase/poly-beta-1,6-N-acetylglucosamine synthase-like glycosyltransferase
MNASADNQPLLSIVVPAYNEEATLADRWTAKDESQDAGSKGTLVPEARFLRFPIEVRLFLAACSAS